MNLADAIVIELGRSGKQSATQLSTTLESPVEHIYEALVSLHSNDVAYVLDVDKHRQRIAGARARRWALRELEPA